MTFAEVSQLIISGLKQDGDVPFDLPTGTPYFSTAFGLRLQLLLSSFTRDAYQLFAIREPITIEAGDREFSFADPENCALSFYEVHRLWIGGNQVDRLTSFEMILQDWTPLTPAGRPSSFAQLDPEKILFNVAAGDDYEDAYAQGFYRHPRFSADDEPVLLAEEVVLLFDRYAQAFMRRDVASDPIGLTRLRMIDQEAYEAINRLRGEKLRAMMSGARW